MNRLALIAATGFLALALTACGEHGNKQPPVATDNAPQQQGAPAPQQQPTEGQGH
ncbi:hypothetical protein J2N86_06830 [Legionella lytica]|uniref:Uncharacterized protein n=1 Tax=Legionella lytica TaxID=96232 RepID=A0ABY4YBH2_9GAMM|nr:hypothetical protein [Legionella lytica]USQ15003.1 hypothetical protein J2N86_06830 [Legionella lytica]